MDLEVRNEEEFKNLITPNDENLLHSITLNQYVNRNIIENVTF